MQRETILLCPNAVVNIPNEMARKRKQFNFGMVKRLVLPLNVGKRANGDMFIGGINDSGNHWALVIVELRPYKRIIYCDTLAWDPPSILVDVVNNFTRHMPRVEDFTESHLSIAHSPLATSPKGHQCDWRCRNYSLQTCSDICGVIVLINAALAALNKPFFQYLIGPYEKERIFVQSPTEHSRYLRRVIMAWFAEGRIDIDYVLPKTDSHLNGIPSQFDHTFCFRQDTSINSKRKLKLSLNHNEKAAKHQSSPKESSPNSPSAGSTTHAKTDSNASNNANTSKGHVQSKTSTLSEFTNNSDGRPKGGKQNKAKTSKSDQRSEKPSLSVFTNNTHTSTESPSMKQGKKSKATTSKITSKPKRKKSKSPVLIDCTNTYSTKDLPSSNGPSTPPSRKPASRDKENTADSAPTDSVPVSKSSGNYQCEHCGLQLSSRNCLYKHKMRKHAAENAKKAVQSKNVLCPDCKEKESR